MGAARIDTDWAEIAPSGIKTLILLAENFIQPTG
jgi:hypothetical protein